MPEKDANLNEDKSNETDQEVKVEGESSKSLSFRQMMRGLSPHHLPLKDRMRVKLFLIWICFDLVHLPRNHTRSM